MKLGLLTDIHEHIEYLRAALDCFAKERVDQVVVIGDLFEMGERVSGDHRPIPEPNAAVTSP